MDITALSRTAAQAEEAVRLATERRQHLERARDALKTDPLLHVVPEIREHLLRAMEDTLSGLTESLAVLRASIELHRALAAAHADPVPAASVVH